jgi:hypothetical protein
MTLKAKTLVRAITLLLLTSDCSNRYQTNPHDLTVLLIPISTINSYLMAHKTPHQFSNPGFRWHFVTFCIWSSRPIPLIQSWPHHSIDAYFDHQFLFWSPSRPFCRSKPWFPLLLCFCWHLIVQTCTKPILITSRFYWYLFHQ